MKKEYFSYGITNGLYKIIDGADTIKEAREIRKNFVEKDMEVFGNAYSAECGEYHIFRLTKDGSLGKKVI